MLNGSWTNGTSTKTKLMVFFLINWVLKVLRRHIGIVKNVDSIGRLKLVIDIMDEAALVAAEGEL